MIGGALGGQPGGGEGLGHSNVTTKIQIIQNGEWGGIVGYKYRTGNCRSIEQVPRDKTWLDCHPNYARPICSTG